MRSTVQPVSVILLAGICAMQAHGATFKKLTLTDKFYCEGAYAADFNRDGNMDVVSGPYWYAGPDFQKRHEVREPKAFDPKGDKEPNAPAVVYWFQLKRNADGSAQFVPHRIDDDSGVGTQVAAADLNVDGTPDVIVGNKKGTFVFLSE